MSLSLSFSYAATCLNEDSVGVGDFTEQLSQNNCHRSSLKKLFFKS